MPVTVKLISGMYRVVERSTGKIAKNKKGTPVDGGGHFHSGGANKQAQAININLHKRK